MTYNSRRIVSPSSWQERQQNANPPYFKFHPVELSVRPEHSGGHGSDIDTCSRSTQCPSQGSKYPPHDVCRSRNVLLCYFSCSGSLKIRSGPREKLEITILSAPVGKQPPTYRHACYMMTVHLLYITTQPVIVQSRGSSPPAVQYIHHEL